MAREHKIEIWCDPCLNLDDIHVEGDEMPPITIGNAKPRVIAMCKEHKVNFFDPFVEAITEMGVPLDKLTGPAPKPPTSHRSATDGEALIPCPKCDSELRNRSSLASHLRQIHESTVADAYGDTPVMDTQGNILPAPRTAPPPKPGEERFACPECPGVVYEWPKHTRPKQAMSVHVARLHPEMKGNWVELTAKPAPKRAAKKAS